MRTNQRGKRSAASRPVDDPDGSSLVSAPAITHLAWALTALSALLLVLAVGLLVLNRDLGFRALTPHLVLVPGFAVVGLVLAVRRPGHAIGWLFVGMGLAAAVHSFAFEYAIRALVTAPGSLPAGSWMAWLAYWTWTLNLPALALLLLLFPDGRLPSPGWRAVPWLLGAAIAGVTGWTMLQPGPIDLSLVRIANPAGVAALGDPAVQAVAVPSRPSWPFSPCSLGRWPAPRRRSCGADGPGRSSASSSSGWRLWLEGAGWPALSGS